MERWENNKAMHIKEYQEKISNLLVVKNNDNYNLRNNGIDYTLEKPRTNFLKKSISYCGAKMWNELPVELNGNNLSQNTFKTLLRDRSRLNSSCMCCVICKKNVAIVNFIVFLYVRIVQPALEKILFNFHCSN